VTLEQQRLQWLDSSPGEPALVRAAIQSFHLLPNDLVALRDLGAALAEVKDLGVVARILLAHPAWEVRNSVAEAFGIAAKRRSDVPSICRELLESSDWRLRYGAVNVAYALRFQDRQLTIEVMQRGALDDHAWVSGLSADFLFDRFAGAPRALQERRIAEQTLHLDKLAQTRDMWVAYSLFHLAQTFNEEGWSDALPIARVGALLHDIPGWSTMDEDEFYAQLDRLM
jgi:hypothetical protein